MLSLMRTDTSSIRTELGKSTPLLEMSAPLDAFGPSLPSTSVLKLRLIRVLNCRVHVLNWATSTRVVLFRATRGNQCFVTSTLRTRRRALTVDHPVSETLALWGASGPLTRSPLECHPTRYVVSRARHPVRYMISNAGYPDRYVVAPEIFLPHVLSPGASS